ASWSPDIVPGQDLGIRLQAFLGWVNNYAHMPYEKQQEMLWELGQIEIWSHCKIYYSKTILQHEIVISYQANICRNNGTDIKYLCNRQ
nr:hypothetical protein [Nostoc sp. DedSLP05]MDZ8101552.1 hypothetical protein [Nostoc sp. DedSLP01]